MSFSDPFNRVSRKREKEYLAFHEQLKRGGIDTEEKAGAVLEKSQRHMLRLCAAVVVIMLLVSLVRPDLAGITLVFGGLVLMWLAITMVRGRRMMKRFIDEEFAGKP